jgi:hypothetical protein
MIQSTPGPSSEEEEESPAREVAEGRAVERSVLIALTLASNAERPAKITPTDDFVGVR